MKSPHFYRKQQHSLCCRRIILLKIDLCCKNCYSVSRLFFTSIHLDGRSYL
ncbi:hypothetical protein EVA_15271 [gut metagenome]|uniref:Uncharacterized protein n=1 Tax=gut metagenome TaxID=749906 RepID=J9G490_9ZZZZ